MEIFCTLSEKIIHLKALAAVAICDDSLDEKERAHLLSIQKIYGVPEDIFNIIDVKNSASQDIELSQILSQITDQKHKLALIQDLISCAYCDGSYSDVEKKKLRDISSALGIPEQKVLEIEELNVELQNAYKKLAISLSMV